MQDPEKQGTGCNAGRPIRPSEPPHPLLEEVMWVVNNYQRLSGPLNV